MLGAVFGGMVAYLFAPQNGSELTGKVRGRLDDVRIAGAQAKLDKQRELISRFRETVNDPGALAGADAKAAEALKVRMEAALRARASGDAVPSGE